MSMEEQQLKENDSKVSTQEKNEEPLELHFEVCTNCSEHSWFLKHKESDYSRYYDSSKLLL